MYDRLYRHICCLHNPFRLKINANLAQKKAEKIFNNN